MLAIAGTSVLAVAVGVLSTAKSEAWGDGSAVVAAARGSIAAAVVAGAMGAAALMSLAAVCSSVALVSGAIAASFSASAELAIGVSAAGAMLFKASFSGAAGVAATGSTIFDSDGCAVATWLASAVAVASVAIAAVLTTDDSPRIAGDTRSKFQKVLFMFLTPSHFIQLDRQFPTDTFCGCLPVDNN